MSDVLFNLRRRLNPGGTASLVLGDSRSTVGGALWVIPTVDSVAAIAVERGFAVDERISITVTRENVMHSKHTITQNVILRLYADKDLS